MPSIYRPGPFAPPKLLLALALLPALAMLPHASWAAAHACSGDETLRERIDRAELAAEGWVESYTVRPDLRQPLVPVGHQKDGGFGLVPVEVTVRLVHRWWGAAWANATGSVTFVDYGSAYLWPDGTIQWAGSAGACGVLDADPTGLAVFGAGPDDPPVRAFRDYAIGIAGP